MSHDEIPLAHANDCELEEIMDINEARKWPAPADQIPGQPIEHVREESWSARIDRVATESLSVDGQIAHLRAEVDGLRLLDETNRLEMERVRVALHAKKDETTSVAAARVWSELLAAEGRGRDVLSALGRPIIEDPVKAAQRIVRERDEAHDAVAKMMAERDVARRDFEAACKRAASARDAEQLVENVSAILGIGNGSLMAVASTIAAERDDARRALELERADNVALRSDAVQAEMRVEMERADWHANNEALRLERDDVRKVLAAQPHETVTMAAQRVVDLSEVRKKEILRQDGEHMHAFSRVKICEALGVSTNVTFSVLIEHAGQLRDDSVAYRSLRGRLVGMLGCPADFSEKDVADMVADRINGPITDAEDNLVEQVQQLEVDVTTLKAALHVATRAVQS